MAGPIDRDLALIHKDEVIFDTGASADARIVASEYEGWISAASPNISADRYQTGRTGPRADALKGNSGFTLQTVHSTPDLRTIDNIRITQPHRRITALLKKLSRNDDVWFRFGYYHVPALPVTVADFVTRGVTFMQAEQAFESWPMAASGDHYFADAAPSTDIGRDFDLATDAPPVVIVDVRDLAVAVPADHSLTVSFTDGTTPRTITLASGGASALAGTNPLREGLYIADFTDSDNYSGADLPATGTFNVQWAGTGIATLQDANRAIDVGIGRAETIPE